MDGNQGNNQTINKILADEDKGISKIPFTEGGILARIFRRFLLLNVNAPMVFYRLMKEYVKQVESGEAGVRTDMVSVKGNTTKVLSRDEFTWKNFMTAMRFLQTRQLRIIIERTDNQGNVQTVEEIIQFNAKAKALQQEFAEQAKDKEI